MTWKKIADVTRLEERARTSSEVRLYADFHPCSVCGCRDIGEPETHWYARDGKGAGHYDITCPQCGHERRVMFYETPDFYSSHHLPGHLGGPEPSNIIEPHQFAAGFLYYIEHLTADMALWKVEASINELRKFLPDGADEIPPTAFRSEAGRAAREQHPERFTRAFMDEQAARVAVLRLEAANRPAAPSAPVVLPPLGPPLGPIMVKRHAAWREGKEFGQRLHAVGVDAPGARLSTIDLTAAILENTTLDRADLSFTSLHAAQLTDVRARHASFSSGMLAGTTITRSTFAGSAMNLAKLGDATISDSDFSDAVLERSTWYRSKVSRCTFARSVLTDTGMDRAVFTDCDFRGADLGKGRDIINSAFETEFVRCDLRDTNWDGRGLHRTKFIDCKFAGAHGTPVVFVVIERPDLSLDGDGSQIGTTRDVLVQWGINPDAPVRPEAPAPAKPWGDRVQLAESVLLAALDRGATFEDTVAALMAAGFTREQSLEAMIDPSSVKPRPQG